MVHVEPIVDCDAGTHDVVPLSATSCPRSSEDAVPSTGAETSLLRSRGHHVGHSSLCCAFRAFAPEKRWLLRSAFCFPHNFFRVFVISQSDKARMPQVIRVRPIREIDLSHQTRLEPPVRLHRFCRERFAAPGILRFRQVGKWTFRRCKPLKRAATLRRSSGVKPFRTLAIKMSFEPS
jgi:hypothetical protein